MLADIIIDILFGLNILIGFFVPLRTSEGKAIFVTFVGDYVYDRKALCKSKLKISFILEIISVIPFSYFKYISTASYL